MWRGSVCGDNYTYRVSFQNKYIRQHGSPPEWEKQSTFALIVFKQNILNGLDELLRTWGMRNLWCICSRDLAGMLQLQLQLTEHQGLDWLGMQKNPSYSQKEIWKGDVLCSAFIKYRPIRNQIKCTTHADNSSSCRWEWLQFGVEPAPLRYL